MSDKVRLPRCFADEFILPPNVPFMVQPPAFYTLVAEFEARGFDSTTTPESGIRAQVLRLSSFYDVISVA